MVKLGLNIFTYEYLRDHNIVVSREKIILIRKFILFLSFHHNPDLTLTLKPLAVTNFSTLKCSLIRARVTIKWVSLFCSFEFWHFHRILLKLQLLVLLESLIHSLLYHSFISINRYHWLLTIVLIHSFSLILNAFTSIMFFLKKDFHFLRIYSHKLISSVSIDIAYRRRQKGSSGGLNSYFACPLFVV